MAFNTRMANGNANPYASSGVIADTMPIVQYEMQRQAKKAASEAATDKYLQDLQKVDDKGLRAIDYGGLSELTKASRDIYNGNREAIRRPELDGGRKLNEFMASIEGQKKYIAESSQATEGEKDFGKYIEERKKAGDPLTADEFAIMDKYRNNAIRTDNFYKDKNLKSWHGIQDLEDFNKYKQEDFLKDAVGLNERNKDILVPNQKLVTNPITGKVSQRYADSYDDKTYNNMLDNASYIVSQTPKYKKYFEHKIDGNEFLKLDQAFKEKFGRGIEIPTMTADLAKAVVLKNIPQHTYHDKEETDEQMKRRLDNAEYDRRKNKEWAYENNKGTQNSIWIDRKIDEQTPKLPPSTNALYPYNTPMTSEMKDPLILRAVAEGDENPKMFYDHQNNMYNIKVPKYDAATGKAQYIKKTKDGETDVTDTKLTDDEVANGVSVTPVYSREVTIDRKQLRDLMAENIKNQKYIINERKEGKKELPNSSVLVNDNGTKNSSSSSKSVSTQQTSSKKVSLNASTWGKKP
jgi:hypothetical protein